MNYLLRLRFALGFLLLLLTVLWRAQPAFARGTFYVEGGLWLEHIWQRGFWSAATEARTDYWTLGNAVVIQLADWLNAWCSSLEKAAQYQIAAACVYAAGNLWLCGMVVRRHFGAGASVLVLAAMILSPELGADLVCFGEASNIGYFSATATAFILLDLWLSGTASRPRLLLWLLLLTFHVMTSPGAAALVVGFAGLRLITSLWQWKFGVTRRPRFEWLGWALAAAVCAAYLVRIRLATHDFYLATHDEEVRSGLVEIVFCRQLLFPLMFPWYQHFSNTLTIILLGMVIASIGWLIHADRRSMDPQGRRIMVAAGLLFCAAAGMALSTTGSRQWILTLWKSGYESTDPDRYYLTQNMLMCAAFSLAVWRACQLFPKCRPVLLTLAVLQTGGMLTAQAIRLAQYPAELTTTEISLRWPQALRRAMESAEGIASSDTHPMGLPVQIQSRTWGIFVPWERLPAQLPEKPAEACMISFGDEPSPDKGRKLKEMKVENIRFMAAGPGELKGLSFDVQLPQGTSPGKNRRTLFLPQVFPGKAKAWLYQNPGAGVGARIKVLLQGPWPAGKVASGPMVFSSDGVKYTASGELPAIMQAGGFSCWSGEERPASRPPQTPAFHWKENDSPLAINGVPVKAGEPVTLSRPEMDRFDEAWFLSSEPAAAEAVKSGAVRSAKDFCILTQSQASICAETIKFISPPGPPLAAFDSVRLELSLKKGPLPYRLLLRLSGPGTPPLLIPLAAPDQPAGRTRTYFARGFGGVQAGPITEFEILIPSDEANRQFAIRSLEFFPGR